MNTNKTLQSVVDTIAKNGSPTVSAVFFPGAGGGATLWKPVAERFGGIVMPLPAVESIREMADSVEPSVRLLPEPRILVGNSLGAMVALEIAQRLPVAGLMLIAAGWEFPVSEELIRRVDTRGRHVFTETARRCVNPDAAVEHAQAVVADFESREDGTMVRHLRAIRDHQPWIDTHVRQPTTFVLRGGLDRSVSLRDHIELAERTGGALVPVASAAHMPFVDHSEEVTQWLTRLQTLALAR